MEKNSGDISARAKWQGKAVRIKVFLRIDVGLILICVNVAVLGVKILHNLK